MGSSVNNDLRVPYEIGVFIASQVPYLDSNFRVGYPWAEHTDQFKTGPNPLYNQMKQGLILEVINNNHRPRAIYTRYGQWMILGSCNGSFDKVFEVVQKKLNLIKIEELSNENASYYAIKSWDEKYLGEPIQADKRAGEFIPYEEGKEAYREFKSFMSENYQ